MSLEPLLAKWSAFGWKTCEIDGHDIKQIIETVEEAKTTKGKPIVIIANTIKGKGVSFMENKPGWHGKSVNDEEFKLALEEIKRGI